MNSVVLIGRLTKDPEIRYTPENLKPVATFSIAVDRPFAKEKTADFFNIVVFGKPAENCGSFLIKGRLVGIQGRLQNDSYTDKEGIKRYRTDIIADRVEFLEWGDKAKGGLPPGITEDTEDDEIPF